MLFWEFKIITITREIVAYVVSTIVEHNRLCAYNIGNFPAKIQSHIQQGPSVINLPCKSGKRALFQGRSFAME